MWVHTLQWAYKLHYGSLEAKTRACASPKGVSTCVCMCVVGQGRGNGLSITKYRSPEFSSVCHRRGEGWKDDVQLGVWLCDLSTSEYKSPEV